MNAPENNPSPVEVPNAEIPPENQTPPQPAPPPPAATLVVEGEVTDEKHLAAQREIERRERELEEREARARDTEMTIAERERKAQEREEALRHTPTQKKAKRKRNWSDPVFSPEEIEED